MNRYQSLFTPADAAIAFIVPLAVSSNRGAGLRRRASQVRIDEGSAS